MLIPHCRRKQRYFRVAALKNIDASFIFLARLFVYLRQLQSFADTKMKRKKYTINVNGKLMVLDVPVVMGILNVTPDSFFEGSRLMEPELFIGRARRMISDGAAILDVGACSTRPGGEPVPEKEELERLHRALSLLDREFPDAVVSLDTFRGAVVRECVREHNVAIINDVSGFAWDDSMFDAVVDSRLPYVLTHSAGLAGSEPEYTDFLPQVLQGIASKMWQLRQSGVHDIIVDPGFGFGKSLEQNFSMLSSLGEFAVLDAPVLVGVSRKSMITKLLGCSPEGALTGTVALNMAALMSGAVILRVHDVKEAADTVKLFNALSCKTKS
jgi:dihydropteroate synthase